MRTIGLALVLFLALVSFSFLCLEVFPLTTVHVHGPANPPVDPCGLRAVWALDGSLPVRYAVFVGNFLRGEWGVTWFCQPVLPAILSAAPDSLLLAFGGLAVSAVLARVLGPWLARRDGRWPDAAGSGLALASTALPPAGLALLLAVSVLVLSPGSSPLGSRSPDAARLSPVLQAADYLGHLVLPLLAVAACSVGFLTIAMRNASLREVRRSGPGVVFESLVGHRSAPGEVRYGIPSLWPELAPYVAWTLGSALLVEMVFLRDGLGTLLLRAGYQPFVASGVFLFTSLVVIGVTAALDLLVSPEDAAWAPVEIPRLTAREPRVRMLRTRFLGRAVLVAGAMLLLLIGMTALAASLVGTYTGLGERPFFAAPSPAHLLGTGMWGLDVASEVVAGGQIPLLVAGFAFGVSVLAGAAVALASGSVGGRADVVADGVIRSLLRIPWVPLAALVALVSGVPGYVLVAFLAWPIAGARLRADILELMRNGGFPGPRWEMPPDVERRAPRPHWNGSTIRILALLAPLILSSACFAASLAILIVAGLAWMVGDGWFVLGAGPASWPSWEAMLAGSFAQIFSGPWFAILPFVLALLAAGLVLAGLGFSLRQAALTSPSTTSARWAAAPREDCASRAPHT